MENVLTISSSYTLTVYITLVIMHKYLWNVDGKNWEKIGLFYKIKIVLIPPYRNRYWYPYMCISIE